MYRPAPVGATTVTWVVEQSGFYSDLELFSGGCVEVSATVAGAHPPASTRTPSVRESG